MSKQSHLNKLVRGSVVVLGIAGFGFGIYQWGNHSVERAFYNVKSVFNVTSVRDEARMAFICYKLERLKCRYDALTKAYKKAPQNESITGEYAIALSEVGKHDQAILTFQKYFSVADGTPRHQASFAKSLAAKEYYADSKEWYYKAIKTNPRNLDVAEEMIDMLRKSQQYGEAMSIIGHYDLFLPQTRKAWAKLSQDLKAEYKAFQQEYAIKEMTVSQIGQYFFAPGIIEGSLDTQLFIVNPESDYTTVEIGYLESNGIPYETKGSINVTAKNGTELTGTKVIIPSLIFGAFQLKNVEAVACKNCAFVAGKSILNRLSISETKLTNAHVNLLSMSQK